MDQEDPEKRIAELERQLAAAKAVAEGQEYSEPVLSQWPTPRMPPPPAPPQTGPPVGWNSPQNLGPPAGRRSRTAVWGTGSTIGHLWPIIVVVVVVSIVGAFGMELATPSSTMWTSWIVCPSPYHLTYTSFHSQFGGGKSGNSTDFQCVSGINSSHVNEFRVFVLQALLIALVLCGAVALVVLIRRLLRRSRPGIFLPLFVIVVVGCLMLVVTTNSESSPTGPTQLNSADGLSGLLTKMRDRFGDTMGYSLIVHPDYAILDRSDPQDDRNEQPYLYKSGGNWSESGSSTSLMSDDSLADLSKFNIAAVTAELKDAPQALDMKDGDTAFLWVQGGAGGSLSLTIHDSDGHSGYMDINPDGGVKQLHLPY
jgi:hypothetical protein